MNAFLSITFMISFLIMFFGVYIFKKSKVALNGVIWVVPSLFICFFYFAFSFGILIVFNAPVNLVSGIIVCLSGSAVTWFFAVKKKMVQKFFFCATDLICVLLIGIFSFYLGFRRFGISLTPVYETSDPSVHLQMAMNVVNTGTLDRMFFSGLINSFAVQAASFILKPAFYYRAFVLADIIFFALSGIMLYSALSSRINSSIKKVIALVLTLFYIIGYPLNNMLFGFCYWGISVTVIALIIMLTYYVDDAEYDQIFLTAALMTGLFSVSMGYILYAPLVYVGVFITVALIYKINGRKFFGKEHICRQLALFAAPVILTLYHFVIKQHGVSLSGLAGEGYIYRDLFSNFLFFAFPVLLMICKCIKEKKVSPPTVMFAVFLIYVLGAFVLMYKGGLSSYYFYKVHYPLMMICFFVAFEIVAETETKMLYRPICYLAVVCLLFAGAQTNIETRIRNKNVLYNSRTVMPELFDLYEFNKNRLNGTDREIRTVLWHQRVELYSYVMENCEPDNNVYLFDDWLNVYWYEAVTSQRFAVYEWNGKEEFENFCKNCKYAVVIPSSDCSKNNAELFSAGKIIYKNEIGYVVKLK